MNKKTLLQFLKTDGRRLFQSNSRTRCLHEQMYWKPKWVCQSFLSTGIWHNYTLCPRFGGVALALTKKEVRMTIIVLVVKTKNLEQHMHDNKLFPVHRKCYILASSQICQQLFWQEANISVFNSAYDVGANRSELVETTSGSNIKILTEK